MGVVFIKGRVSSPVADSPSEELVGVTTLKGRGFIADPVRRQLKELPLLL